MTKTEKRLLVGLVAVGGLAVVASAFLAAGLLVATIGAPDRVGRALEGATRVPTSLTRAVDNERSVTARSEPRLAEPAAPRLGLPLATGRRTVDADLATLYEQVTPGVVSVEVRTDVQSPFGGGEFPQQGSGSGFVVDDRHIVTNNHVVSGADTVEIVFYDGERREGQVLATDRFSDLAVIRLDDMPRAARALPILRDFGSLEVGQPVVALGNPFGNAQTMTYGIISALGRVIPSGATQFSIPQAIQTDAAINPGNSGGPLMDLSGQVIGVNAQINTSNQGIGSTPANSGVGFAIPSSVLNKVVPDLIEKGSHAWAYLGVTGMSDITLEVAKANNLDDARGAYITQVVPGGPADGKLSPPANAAAVQQAQPSEQGLQVIPFGQSQQAVPVGGDIVVEVDGRPVSSFDDLLTYVALEKQPGDTIELKALRGGRTVTVSITLGTRPTSGQVQSEP